MKIPITWLGELYRNVCLGISSVGSADQHTGVPRFESTFQIEEHIRKLGLPYTIIRPVFFMENWLGMRARMESGMLALRKPDTRLQMSAVDDIGAFVAMASEFPERWQGRALDMPETNYR